MHDIGDGPIEVSCNSFGLFVGYLAQHIEENEKVVGPELIVELSKVDRHAIPLI